MRRWEVVTPEFPYQEVIDPELGGPWYDVCDVIEVEAETRRDALLLGVHAMSEDHRHYEWCRTAREDGECPFAGVKVYPVPAEEYVNAVLLLVPDGDFDGPPYRWSP